MADKLKQVLSKLSQEDQKKPKKEVEPEEPIEEEEEEFEEDEEEEDDETEEEKPVAVKSKPELSDAEKQIRQNQVINEEITRLRDHGVFNAEVLFQNIKTNNCLERIATSLEKLLEKFNEADGTKE